MAVLLEAPQAGKAKMYLESASFQGGQSNSSMMAGVQCNGLAKKWPADPPQGKCHPGGLALAPAAEQVGHSRGTVASPASGEQSLCC